MAKLVAILFPLFLILGALHSCTATCTIDTTVFEKIDQELVEYSGEIGIDEFGFEELPALPLEASFGSQNFKLFGLGCSLSRSTDFSSIAWYGDELWYNDPLFAMPGAFWAATSDYGCRVTFTPPISAFSVRVNTASGSGAYMEVLTTEGVAAACTPITHVAGANTWTDVGFVRSGAEFIDSVTFFAPQVLADNLRYRSACPDYEYYENNTCIDKNECTLLEPCNDMADCYDFLGGYNCTCFEGYEGNGYAGGACTEIKYCYLEPCSPLAIECIDLFGGYQCTCPDGYEGDGVGPDGCTLPPTSEPASGPESGPSGAGPSGSGPSAGPSGSGPSAGPSGSGPSAGPSGTGPGSVGPGAAPNRPVTSGSGAGTELLRVGMTLVFIVSSCLWM